MCESFKLYDQGDERLYAMEKSWRVAPRTGEDFFSRCVTRVRDHGYFLRKYASLPIPGIIQ